MAGMPPQIPPPMISGLTEGPGPTGGMGPMMPPMPNDDISRVTGGIKNRQGSANQMMKTVRELLQRIPLLDSRLKDQCGAALACIRGPSKPGEKPDMDYDY